MMVASTFVESYPKGLQVFAFALTMGVIGYASLWIVRQWDVKVEYKDAPCGIEYDIRKSHFDISDFTITTAPVPDADEPLFYGKGNKCEAIF